MEKVTHNVFFSWQSDRDSKICKNLIEWSLNRAINALAADMEVVDAMRDEGLELDKDTKGIPGSPPIVETILNKIAEATIFVPDLTYVGTRIGGHPTPNPNVLIEYGWALRCHGHSRIIAVMNDAFGHPSAGGLPFDLRHTRFPICFTCPEDADADARKIARERLAKELTGAIKTILTSKDFVPVDSVVSDLYEPTAPLNGRARFRADREDIGVSDSAVSSLFGRPASLVKLMPGGAMWLRVMPRIAQTKTWSLAEIRNALTNTSAGSGMIVPMVDAYRNFDYVRGADGWGIFATPLDDGADVPGLVYVFERGEIWAIDTYPVQAWGDQKKIFFLEPYFTQALPRYAQCLTRLGVIGPLQWEAGIEGIRGYSFVNPDQPGRLSIERTIGPFLKNEISARGDYSIDARPVDQMRHFFEMIFDACGKPRPEFLNQ